MHLLQNCWAEIVEVDVGVQVGVPGLDPEDSSDLFVRKLPIPLIFEVSCDHSLNVVVKAFSFTAIIPFFTGWRSPSLSAESVVDRGPELLAVIVVSCHEHVILLCSIRRSRASGDGASLSDFLLVCCI